MNAFTSYSLLPIHEIDLQNSTYRIRPFGENQSDHTLADHIGRYGILQPPLVQQKKNTTLILSGRRRVEAAHKLKIDYIPCLIVNNQATPTEFFETILVHALTGSKLSIIEQALFLKKAAETLNEQQTLSLLPLLGIKSQPYKLQEFSSFLQLVPSAITALHTGTLLPKTAGKLGKLSSLDQQELVKLIEYFKLGGTKQKKIITYALELVMRTDKQLVSFTEDWQKEEKAFDNRPQQANALLKKLAAQCYPKANQAEYKFQQLLQSLHFPDHITLNHTPSFEDDQLTLSIRYKNQAALRLGWQELQQNAV